MSSIQFETPENVRISYSPAGLGTRFLAWFVDSIVMWLSLFVLLIVVICTGAISDSFLRESFNKLDAAPRGPDDMERMGRVMMYLGGFWVLVWSLGSFFYYGLSELLFRGQTIGKRMSQIRVVKADGFALDSMSILVRNIFRVVDHLPPLWLVPLLSARGQRLGDMVAGTIVIQDQHETLDGPRLWLSNRTAAESRFRFDAGQLKKLRPQDVPAIEQILQRWSELPDDRREALLTQIMPGLCQRLGAEQPVTDPTNPYEDARQRFLEDLLAAEYRRQNRQLG